MVGEPEPVGAGGEEALEQSHVGAPTEDGRRSFPDFLILPGTNGQKDAGVWGRKSGPSELRCGRPHLLPPSRCHCLHERHASGENLFRPTIIQALRPPQWSSDREEDVLGCLHLAEVRPVTAMTRRIAALLARACAGTSE